VHDTTYLTTGAGRGCTRRADLEVICDDAPDEPRPRRSVTLMQRNCVFVAHANPSDIRRQGAEARRLEARGRREAETRIHPRLRCRQQTTIAIFANGWFPYNLTSTALARATRNARMIPETMRMGRRCTRGLQRRGTRSIPRRAALELEDDR